MKPPKVLWACLFWAAIFSNFASAMAQQGLYDSHHVWRDAAYWHERHPDWVYRYHPDWAVEAGWWRSDRERHPEWFGSPFWRDHPLWTYGAYDKSHVWRQAEWWHAHDPAWVYSHHPEWAEPYPQWMREDYGRHPEWFHSSYWHEHPHNWEHPYEDYDRYIHPSGAYREGHYTGWHNQHYGEYHRHSSQNTYEQNRGYKAYAPAHQRSAHQPPSVRSYTSSSGHGRSGGSGGGGSHKK